MPKSYFCYFENHMDELECDDVDWEALMDAMRGHGFKEDEIEEYVQDAENYYSVREAERIWEYELERDRRRGYDV